MLSLMAFRCSSFGDSFFLVTFDLGTRRRQLEDSEDRLRSGESRNVWKLDI